MRNKFPLFKITQTVVPCYSSSLAKMDQVTVQVTGTVLRGMTVVRGDMDFPAGLRCGWLLNIPLGGKRSWGFLFYHLADVATRLYFK